MPDRRVDEPVPGLAVEAPDLPGAYELELPGDGVELWYTVHQDPLSEIVTINVVRAIDRPRVESAYSTTLSSMSTQRVTVTLPEEVRRAAQRIADERGESFSAIVNEALSGWLRGRLVDIWLAEHQAAHGVFDENELRDLAAEAGVPYVGPGRAGESAA